MHIVNKTLKQVVAFTILTPEKQEHVQDFLPPLNPGVLPGQAYTATFSAKAPSGRASYVVTSVLFGDGTGTGSRVALSHIDAIRAGYEVGFADIAELCERVLGQADKDFVSAARDALSKIADSERSIRNPVARPDVNQTMGRLTAVAYGKEYFAQVLEAVTASGVGGGRDRLAARLSQLRPMISALRASRLEPAN